MHSKKRGRVWQTPVTRWMPWIHHSQVKVGVHFGVYEYDTWGFSHGGQCQISQLPHLFPTFLYHAFNFVKEWERRMAVLCSKKGSTDVSWKGWLLKWHNWLALIWVHESNNGILTHKRRKRVAHESSISLHIIRVLALHVPRTIPKGCGN